MKRQHVVAEVCLRLVANASEGSGRKGGLQDSAGGQRGEVQGKVREIMWSENSEIWAVSGDNLRYGI